MAEYEFDVVVTAAWTDFTLDLTRRLTHLDPGDQFDIAQSPEFPGPHGRIRFSVTGAGRRRATIAESDLHTSPDCLAEQSEFLQQAGWRRLRNRTLICEVGVRRSADLAGSSVHALRGVWDVVHPAFLADATIDMPVEPLIDIDPPASDPKSPRNT
ncbi:TY-Chap domain-containing protein [Gordonia sp. NPDC003424]